MIRRTLKSGLLATVAVLVLLPTAAGATAADAIAPRPVPGISTQDLTHRTDRIGRVHHHRYATHRRHHRVHPRTRHLRRAHRIHRLAARRAACRFTPRTAAHRFAMRTAPYRLRYRLAAQPVRYRHLRPATGRVATRHARLNVRSGPGTGYRVIGYRSTGRHVTLLCRTRGSSVYGNRTWYRLAHHAGYVSAHYVRADRAVSWC